LCRLYGTHRRAVNVKKVEFLNGTAGGNCGPGSSVGIVTDYGLDGPVSNPRKEETVVRIGYGMGRGTPHTAGVRLCKCECYMTWYGKRTTKTRGRSDVKFLCI